MKIEYLGHSALPITTGGKNILIDPFISGNPMTKSKAELLHPDYIVVTHGHGDHLGDSVAISKRTNALIISSFEVANYCASKGAKTHSMHIGGSFNFDFGRLSLTMALHGSDINDSGSFLSGGNPVGVIISSNGKTLYHAGDTGLFGDMELIAKRFKIDIAFLPIGDNYTMGIDDAVLAVGMLKPEKVVPIHYNTFPLIKADPNEFLRKVSELSEVVIMNPGEIIEI